MLPVGKLRNTIDHIDSNIGGTESDFRVMSEVFYEVYIKVHHITGTQITGNILRQVQEDKQ